MPTILFDSPAIERAVRLSGVTETGKSVFVPRKNNLNTWEPYIPVVSEPGVKFQVVDISEYAEDGSLTTPKVKVIDGTAPESTVCGIINNIPFQMTTLALGSGMNYIYAIAYPNGQGAEIVGLKHEISSNVFTVKLLATVFIENNIVTINQIVKTESDIYVSGIYDLLNASMPQIEYSYSVSDRSLTFSASISGYFRYNEGTSEIPTTALKNGADSFYVGIKKSTVPINTPVEFYFYFGSDGRPEEVDDRERYLLLSYRKTDTVLHIQNIGTPHVFTFTTLYLPSEGEA